MYEQAVEVVDSVGNIQVFQRITVVWNEPTRDCDAEIYILSDLPKRISAIQIARLYRDRWQIGIAFQEVRESLEDEFKALGYP